MQNQTWPRRSVFFLLHFFGGDFSPWAEFTKTRMELDAARFVHRHPCVASGQIPRWRDLADSA